MGNPARTPRWSVRTGPRRRSIAPPPIKAKKSFRDTWEGTAAIVAAVTIAIATIVGALIGGDVINVSAGGAVQPPPSSAALPSSSSPPPTPTTPTPDPSPAIKVLRSTGENPLTLTAGYSADLDTMDPAWDVEYSARNARLDINFSGSFGLISQSATDLALVDGPASYDTCLKATGYTKDSVEDQLQAGSTVCVRTSEKRYAFLTVKKLVPRDNPDKIQLDVTVWDPPFQE